VNDLTDDPAGGHDLIALLEILEELIVLRALALLRAKPDEIEDAEDEDPRQQEADGIRASFLWGTDEQDGERGVHGTGAGREW
jgi:hypothetical protein